MSGAAFIDEPVQAIDEEVSALADAATEEKPAPAAADADMPLPRDPRTIFLGGLFFLALFGALYIAAEIVLPVVLAVLLKLLLQPLVRITDRLHVPRALGALLALVLLIGCFVGLLSALASPAATWAGKLPEALSKLQEQLAVLKAPLAGIDHAVHSAETMVLGPGGAATSNAPPLRSPNIVGALFSGTTAIAATLFTTFLVLFYLLVSGETFLRRLVEILPRFGVKRQAVEMAQSVEEHISAYLLTVTAINAVVGILPGS